MTIKSNKLGLLTISKEKKFDLSEKLHGDYVFPNLKIALILPAYNEEKNIGYVLSKIPTKVANTVDIIVIDDGSSDNTAKIAKKFDPVVLKHDVNKGNGAATITGLNYCKEKDKYDIVLILDADGQHDPNFIPLFINTIMKHDVDFVMGNRFEYYYDMKPAKKFCSKLLTAFYYILYRERISDPSNGYRALSKRILDELEFESKYSITQEMLFKIIPHYEFREIPIKLHSRKEGKSFIKIKSYFWRMIISILKFYILPKVNRVSKRLFKKDLTDLLGIQ